MDPFHFKLPDITTKSDKSGKLPQNPFYHRIYTSPNEKIQIFLWGCLLLPLRIPLILLLLLLTWPIASLATLGLTFKANQTRKFSWWRRLLRFIVSRVLIRGIFFISGFYWVQIKGTRAPSAIAPIIVAGPHSSYLDVIILSILGAPSIVAKAELRRIPFYGALLDISQAVCVTRQDKESREDAIKVIQARASGPNQINQVYIYPEGTCSNRIGLLRFKTGAFAPGVPVQPLLIKYPDWNSVDSFTWTFLGPPGWLTVLLTLSRPINRISLEFLPVYEPNDQEKSDSGLYATNVRKIMAKALDTPLIDWGVSDGLDFFNMRSSNVYKKLERLHQALSSGNHGRMTTLEPEIPYAMMTSGEVKQGWMVSKQILVKIWPKYNGKITNSIFKIFDAGNKGFVDLREVMAHLVLLQKGCGVDQILEILFQIYGNFKEEMDEKVLFTMWVTLYDLDEVKAKSLSTRNVQFGEFKNITRRRTEFAKLFAEEISGRIREYPPNPE